MDQSIDNLIKSMPENSAIVKKDTIYKSSGSFDIDPSPGDSRRIIHRGLSEKCTTLFYQGYGDDHIKRYENGKFVSAFQDQREPSEPLEYAEEIDTFITGKKDGSVHFTNATDGTLINRINVSKEPITAVRYDSGMVYIGTKDGYIARFRKNEKSVSRLAVPFTPEPLGTGEKNYILEQAWRADASIRDIRVLDNNNIAALGKDLYILDPKLNLLDSIFFMRTYELKTTGNIAIVNGERGFCAPNPYNRIRMFDTETKEEKSGIMVSGLISCATTEPFWFDKELYVKSILTENERGEVIQNFSQEGLVDKKVRDLLKDTTILQSTCRF